VQRSGKEQGRAPAAQAAHEDHIFHQRNIGKTAQLLEHLASYEDPLVAIRQTQPAEARGVARGEQPVSEAVGVDSLAESSGYGVRPSGETPFDLSQTIAAKPAVGVLKQQYLAPRHAGPDVLLDRSAGP
jgi:hypothetical protein